MIEPGLSSLPYTLVALGLLSLLAAAALIQGRISVRLAMAAIAGAAMPWAVCNAALAIIEDRGAALLIGRLFVGTLPLIGAAGLFAALSISGRLYRYRRLAAIAAIASVASLYPALATDWVIAGVAETAWGILYPRAGVLADVYVGTFILGIVGGTIIGMRTAQTSGGARSRHEARRVAITLVLLLPCAVDLLLAHGIGVYPLSFVPAALAIARQWHGILRRDLLRATGLDKRALVYGGMLVLAAAILAVLATVSADHGIWPTPITVALTAAPIFLGAEFLAARIARRVATRGPVDMDVAIGELFASATDVRDEAELVGTVAELLDVYLDLRETRLLIQRENGWVPASAADATPKAIDDRVRTWLTANPAPAVADDLSAGQVGALAGPIQRFFSDWEADVALPVTDRERLIGVVVARAPAHRRALNDVEEAALLRVQDAVAQALAYLSLLRDVREKVELSREVEVAAAVQAATSPGEHRLHAGGYEVTACYQPARDFGGDLWVATPISSDRVLVAIGDVTGRGMPAALISAAVVGACETACRMHGPELTLSALFSALNRLVLDVGQSQYAMSCFAAIWNAADNSVSFASAGHPFPFVVSATGGKPALSSLISRGVPFGVDEDPPVEIVTRPFSETDVAVLYTHAITDVRNGEDKRYGERRLRRVLRERVLEAGENACAMIMDDALIFRGNAPARDDTTLVVVRRARETKSASPAA